MQMTNRIQHSLASIGCAMLVTLAGGWSGMALADTADLARTPPSLTKSVDPNIVVTFDDSGSMMATAMPDAISDWEYARDHDYYYSATSNLVYYDPTTTYAPPSKPDGTSFPESSYTNAWRDGMCANWPGSYCSGSANTTNLSNSFDDGFFNRTSSSKTSNDKGEYRWWWFLFEGDIPYQRRGSYYYHGGFYFNCPTQYNDAGCTRVEINSASAAQKQNFANWYSYYRNRNLMVRTAMSRAFGKLGENIRVAWQVINTGGGRPSVTNSRIMALAGDWRDKYFSFLYDVHTTGGTPNRHATIRAGDFFRRGATYNDMDPYWNGLSGDVGDVDEKKDLSCRQNFHMLVTDGYWNGGSPANTLTSEANTTLPDTRKLDVTEPESKIFWNVSGTTYTTSLANIAFAYWATDLRPDLDNDVPSYIKDKTTGVTGSTPFDPAAVAPADDPLNNKEIYWNPVNDPATWQHVVQFMITLGVAGNRTFPDDYDALRDGTKTWPRPWSNHEPAVDDTWHAAVNSRGSYFSAGRPNELVTQLTSVINSIAARGASSTLGGASSSVVTSGAKNYTGGYDSAAWSGTVVQRDIRDDGSIDPTALPNWDAGCFLTGGNCKATGTTTALRDPDDRQILTSKDDGANNGVAFRWASLESTDQAALNINPATGAVDGNGALRLDYLRGDRTQESSTPLMRRRDSVLGAVVNSQVLYLSFPSSLWKDSFPVGSPEQLGAAAGKSYEQFAYDKRNRQAMLYVGANDGMLHGFNADTGAEQFAYVPHATYWSKQPTVPANPTTGVPLLGRLTDRDFNYTPTVDSTPRVRDVFFGSKWHTILVGTLGLGGRGVYALDITDPTTISEATAGGKVLWEFDSSSTGGASLGYTYGTPEIARLATGKWVVLVPGGYFPDCDALGTLDPCDDTVAAANNTFSSLFVLDAETGTLLKELRTNDATQALTGASVKSYGLGTPALYDYQSDQVADAAFAGDLMGNVWRFDLTAATPSGWKTDLLYKGATDSGDGHPLQPITSAPNLLADPRTGRAMVLFGTGRYLGLGDRNLNSLPMQSLYGVRDQGVSDRGGNFPSGYYPASRDQLQAQDLSEGAGGIRFLTDEQLPGANASGVLLKGWKIDLGIPEGERVVIGSTVLPSVGLGIFATLIPGGNDPCNPGTEGSILVINALTGGAPDDVLDSLAYNAGIGVPDGKHVTGQRVTGAPSSGSTIPVMSPLGGGDLMIPGLGATGVLKLTGTQPIYHRGSWRVLNDQ